MLSLVRKYLRYLLGRILQPPQPRLVPSGDAPTPGSVFHDAVARLLDVQIGVNNVLDTRNANLLWIGSAVLPVTVGLLNIGQAQVPRFAVYSLAVSLACYFFLLVTSWWASRFRGLEFRPHIPTLRDHSADYTGDVLQQWVALEYLASTEANGRQLVRKARWVGAANTLLYVEGFFLSLAALVTLL
jgi:hypothetical protein